MLYVSQSKGQTSLWNDLVTEMKQTVWSPGSNISLIALLK